MSVISSLGIGILFVCFSKDIIYLMEKFVPLNSCHGRNVCFRQLFRSVLKWIYRVYCAQLDFRSSWRRDVFVYKRAILYNNCSCEVKVYYKNYGKLVKVWFRKVYRNIDLRHLHHFTRRSTNFTVHRLFSLAIELDWNFISLLHLSWASISKWP